MEQSKQISLGITFLVCCCVLIWLLVARLPWNPEVDTPEPHPYITMAAEPDEEFIDVEVLPPVKAYDESDAPALTEEDMFNESQIAPQTGVDLTTQGKVDKPAQVVTQQKPSPVVEKKQPSSPKPAAAIENQKAQEEKALAQRTKNNVVNSFANANNKNNAKNGTNDEGNAGRKDGDSNSAASPNSKGTTAGISSGTVGGGWKMPAYSRNIPSNEVGSVTFEVAVNRDGSIGKITQISNNGLTSATIAKCRQEIQRHKFSHTDMATAQPATARVTFTFKDPS